VEEAVRNVFDIADFEPTFYATVYSKAAEGLEDDRRLGDPGRLVAHRLLTQLTTSYEAVHSGAMDTYGSLFSNHDRNTAAIVCAQSGVAALDAFGPLVQRRALELAPRLDVSGLSVDEIRRLRDKVESIDCRKALREWLYMASSSPGTIDDKDFTLSTKNLSRRLSEYYRIIREKCGKTNRELLTDVAVVALPNVAAGVPGIVALMGGHVVAAATFVFIGIFSGAAANRAQQILGSGVNDLVVRRKLLRQLRNYVPRQWK
jgi:hypothetical protein